MNEDREAQVHWRKKERTMTLEGERVLSYCLSWPEEENCRRITRYYARVAQLWQDRWEKRLYPLACAGPGQCVAGGGVDGMGLSAVLHCSGGGGLSHFTGAGCGSGA